jgi:hypothetical protein
MVIKYNNNASKMSALDSKLAHMLESSYRKLDLIPLTP